MAADDAEWERLDAPLRRQRLREGLRRLLLRESQVQPVVLVVEDLHWIDGETQAFLDQLVDALPTARLLVLVNYRPEYCHGWGSKSYYRQLRIDPLSPASADQLLAGLLGPDPSLIALRSVLIARTEGNPFFLEESVQSLVETRALAGERGAYRLMKSPEALSMPATVQTILAARIDRLSREDKRLLLTAAVVGKDVPYALLRAIAEVDDTAVQRGARPAASGGVSLRGPALPGARVHLQACPDTRGRLWRPASGPPPRPSCANHRRHRSGGSRSSGRTGGRTRHARHARPGMEQGGALLPAGGDQEC